MSLFEERVTPSPFLIFALFIIWPSITLVLIPFLDLTLCIVLGFISFAATAILPWLKSKKITIDEETFKVGKTWIERKFIGQATPYRGQEAFQQRGQKLDATAWLQIRGGVDPVVKIAINDPEDPTPYWLVSSRKPEEIAKILNGD